MSQPEPKSKKLIIDVQGWHAERLWHKLMPYSCNLLILNAINLVGIETDISVLAREFDVIGLPFRLTHGYIILPSEAFFVVPKPSGFDGMTVIHLDRIQGYSDSESVVKFVEDLQ